MSRYEGWTGLEPMARFVREVSESDFSDKIYAYTSMVCLAIAQTSDVLEDQERFLIVYDPKRGKFRLSYSDNMSWFEPSDDPPTMRGEKAWYRECEPDTALADFRKFLGQVHWI